MEMDLQQQAAATTDSKRALVLSAAGSGKTRTLIERIAYLVETQQVSPYEILSFSFTRKAAGEIQSRLVERIGNKAYKCHLGTMHSVALQMIQRFGDVIGLKTKQITVYGDFESEYLLKDVAMTLGLHTGKGWKKIKKGDIDEVFERYYSTGEEPDELNPAHDLFGAFMARCRENNSMVYGTLLTAMKELIPTMAKYLTIKHILVDEVQDIDTLQWKIIREMEEAFGASLFVVGDIDQSIYSFRGARPEYLLEHQNEFDIYRLESNYRSRASIVEAANRLIQHNVERLPMTMVATIENEPETAHCVVKGDMDSEAIRDYLGKFSSNYHPTILARNHSLLIKLSQLLEEAHIEHRYIGKETKMTNSEEFRRFHAFLKLIVNPFDNFAFLLIKDIIGLSAHEYAQIRQGAAAEGSSHFQIFHEQDGSCAEWYADSDANLIDVADRLPFAFPWPFDVRSIMDFISKYAEDKRNPTVQGYLDWLATIDIQDEVKEDYDGLTLMTIHAAKGLEWDTVIVAGCNEEILPSKQAIREGDVQEERRLAYVACTRARDTLVMTVRPEVTELNGRIYENPVSRFINELT
jgi:DNA helicase-2/ATP-dependent DNA helicase PcrA